jgi:pSer/pThr/pTyr-binding forkhead associated (FHA) protein
MSGTLVLVLRLGMAACLYAFLGWGFFTLWREIRDRGLTLANRKPQPLSLVIHNDHGEILRRTFTQSQVTLGRDPACELCLEDDAISARHIRLSYHHNQWWAEDLGSTNGSRLNQSPLAVPTVLTSGDQIECGRAAIIVSIGADGDPSPTIRLTRQS